MKKQKIKVTGTVLLALTFVGILAISAIRARAQSNNGIINVVEQNRLAQAQLLEGAWTYTVTPVVPPGVPQPPTQRAYITIAHGGGITIYIRTAPGETHYGEQHGAWEHVGGNEFALTGIRDEFDAQGNFLGTGKINTRLTLTGKDGFVGVGSREFRDPAGNIADITRCATIKAVRIKVEPLAAHPALALVAIALAYLPGILYLARWSDRHGFFGRQGASDAGQPPFQERELEAVASISGPGISTAFLNRATDRRLAIAPVAT